MAGREGQSRRALIGGLIMTGLVLLGVTVFLLDDIRDAFARRYSLIVIFPEAPDLVVDAPVWVAGKRVGRVREVTLLPTSFDTLAMVSVRMRLQRDVQSQIRLDSYARLTSARLIGERVVDIVPGSTGMPILSDGDTVAAQIRFPYDIAADRVIALRAELDSMRRSMSTIGDRLPARQAMIEPARREFERAHGELLELRRAIDEGAGAQAWRDAELQDALRRLRGRGDELGTAVDRVAGALPGVELRAGIAQARAGADALAARIDTLRARLRDPDGFIGRWSVDPALELAVEDTRAELDALIEDIGRNPFRFFRLRL